jgi:hypothetical protein
MTRVQHAGQLQEEDFPKETSRNEVATINSGEHSVDSKLNVTDGEGDNNIGCSIIIIVLLCASLSRHCQQ